MKNSILVLLSASVLLVACTGNNPAMLRANNTVKAANASPATQVQNSSNQSDPRYGFRRPVATMEINMFSGSDREMVMNHVKEFMRKYVDQNDIVNYQALTQEGGSQEILFLNIFGGNTEFVLNRLLPDLKYYLNQRARVYKITHYAAR